jgi:pimeloyl-ACP methyl ester carboxylesterase
VPVVHTVAAAMGRRLAVDCWGPEDGYPVFLLHGTPGSRLGPRPHTRDLHLAGIRLITYDRPGYGGSDRLAGRRVSHAADDVAAIARALSLRRFSVVGRSGGAPHALACAALLEDRVRSVAVLASLAPPDAAELSWTGGGWFAGMTESNIRAFRLAREDVEELRHELYERGSAINSDPEQIIVGLDAELSDGDRRIIMETGVRAMLVDNFSAAFDPEHTRFSRAAQQEGAEPGDGRPEPDPAARPALDGWLDDVLSLVNPWGFDVRQIRVPTLLWHGELDRFSPIEHFHWLAEHIRGATSTIAAHSAHFGAVQALPRVLRWLVTAARDTEAQGAHAPGPAEDLARVRA